jgi:hypothetical protein
MTPPKPNDILRYYQECGKALNSRRQAVLQSIETGALPAEVQFIGLTVPELQDAFAELVAELEHQVVLMLTASFEALFQIDRIDRFVRKKKGPISKHLRRWWKLQSRARQEWLKMELLLEAWKKTVGHRQVIGQMKSLFLHRHWLAHGRYWTDKSGLGRVDPQTAWRIGKAVFDVLDGFPPLSAW